MTDLLVQPSDTHQFLDPISSQTCNNLKRLLMKRGYNGKMIRKHILRAQEHSWKDLLEREKAEISEAKIRFNFTYYPVFQAALA